MSNPTDPRKLLALQRELQVLEYRKAGLTYRQIASRLNITPSAAFKAEMRALKPLDAPTREEANQRRSLILMRLDDIQYHLWPAIEKGRGTAIDRVLQIQNRRARLYGISKKNGKKEYIVSNAAKHASERCDARIREEVNQLRESELMRLEEMLYRIWPACENWDCAAVDRAIKILDREARLYCLY